MAGMTPGNIFDITWNAAGNSGKLRVVLNQTSNTCDGNNHQSSALFFKRILLKMTGASFKQRKGTNSFF